MFAFVPTRDNANVKCEQITYTPMYCTQGLCVPEYENFNSGVEIEIGVTCTSSARKQLLTKFLLKQLSPEKVRIYYVLLTLYYILIVGLIY